MPRRFFDRDALMSLSGKQAAQAYTEMRQIANRRFEKLMESGLYKESSLSVIGKRTKWNLKYSRKDYIKMVRFLTSKTSTPSDIKSVRKNRMAALNKLTGGKAREELFQRDLFMFLSSREYELLKYRYQSEDLVEEYTELREVGLSHDNTIQKMLDTIQPTKKKTGKKL